MTKGEIRRNLKQNAKKQLNNNKGVLMGATFIVLVVSFLPTLVSEYFQSINISIDIISILINLIVIPLTVSLMIMTLKCVKYENISMKDLLSSSDRLYQIYSTSLIQYVVIFVLSLPLSLIPLMLIEDQMSAMSMVSGITVIINIFFLVLFSQVEYVIADKKDIKPIESIRIATKIMKGHMWEYLFLTWSFIGWILLVGVTFGIAYIWVGPYMQLTYANFYEYIKEEKINNYKSTNKNGVVPILVIVMLFGGYTMLESKIKKNILIPTVVRNILDENNLDLLSINTEPDYYISQEESIAYKMDLNQDNIIKYTLVVKNHQLDLDPNDNINTTVIYIISKDNKVIGLSCDDDYNNFKADTYNPIPGKFDIKGNEIERLN